MTEIDHLEALGYERGHRDRWRAVVNAVMNIRRSMK